MSVSVAITSRTGTSCCPETRLRTGPMSIPTKIRKRKDGIPVRLKKSSPPNPRTMTAATIAKTRDKSAASHHFFIGLLSV